MCTEKFINPFTDFGSARDYHNTIVSALERGREKGLEEGLEKGREEGREEGRVEAMIEVAEVLKKQGASYEMIAVTTGLPVDEIAELLFHRPRRDSLAAPTSTSSSKSPGWRCRR